MEFAKKTLVWSPQEKKTLLKTRIFSVIEQESLSPENKSGMYVMLDTTDWVITVPVVEKDQKKYFVMVKQWRHGTSSVSIEFPGGVLNNGESTVDGAARELEEETGYKALKMTHLASMSPNPAIMTNHVHFYAAENLVKTTQNLDEDEFVEMLFVEQKEVLENMGKPPYIHSLMGTALQLYCQKVCRIF